MEYTHVLTNGKLEEVEEAIFRFESSGWDFVKLIPEDINSLPTAIIFEWTKSSAPHYPFF